MRSKQCDVIEGRLRSGCSMQAVAGEGVWMSRGYLRSPAESDAALAAVFFRMRLSHLNAYYFGNQNPVTASRE